MAVAGGPQEWSVPVQTDMLRYLTQTLNMLLGQGQTMGMGAIPLSPKLQPWQASGQIMLPLVQQNSVSALKTAPRSAIPKPLILDQPARSPTVSQQPDPPLSPVAGAVPSGGVSNQMAVKNPELQYNDLIQEAAQHYQLDPQWLRSVIATESSFNANAVSPAGAQGLMQLMPATANELGVSNSFDPRQNIMAGSRYLRTLLNRYHGDRNLALAAYNWGMGNLERRPQSLPQETRQYIQKVNQAYQNLRSIVA